MPWKPRGVCQICIIEGNVPDFESNDQAVDSALGGETDLDSNTHYLLYYSRQIITVMIRFHAMATGSKVPSMCIIYAQSFMVTCKQQRRMKEDSSPEIASHTAKELIFPARQRILCKYRGLIHFKQRNTKIRQILLSRSYGCSHA